MATSGERILVTIDYTTIPERENMRVYDKGTVVEVN